MASFACSSPLPSGGNGLKLVRLLINEGTNILKQFLLFSINPETLEIFLKRNLPKLTQLKSKGIIHVDQWERLFPSSRNPSNIDKFDITLLHLLIRELTKLPTPAKGWHKLPEKSDESIEANIARVKCLRNELAHMASTGIPDSEFEEKWNQMSSSLEGIVLYIHQQKIHGLKNDPVDDNNRSTLEGHIQEWLKLQQEESELIFELSSCLPDQMPEGSVYGRSEEISLVKDYVQSRKVAVMMITGGPGFGKTTVAKKSAEKLKEYGQTVLFCSLLRKKTFNEVATEMIHSCRKMPGQLPENPESWLKNWSKQIKGQFTVLVLDNADGIIESEDDRALFLDTLSAMRRLSDNSLTFVITSRTSGFQDLQTWKEVKLRPLSREDARSILNSCVNNEDGKIQLQSSDLDAVAKLCGYVPLALSIVGPLLSDYPKEVLIENLEKEPMDILEGNSESFRKAIANSFDFLKKAEQDALVALSVFPGSFDCKAAKAILQEYSGSLLIPTLRSLKIRSLVEQAGRFRYEMHPLVRAFAKKIGETKCPQALQNRKQLACVHFLSRLEENAQLLYWGKDTCKASIESLAEDRHNYEFFLQFFPQEVADHEISTCQPFLENFAQTCMYLEKCIAPNSYIQFLELLLGCKSFEPQTHPVLRVELLCLLGQEMRRVGKKPRYGANLEEAREIVAAHPQQFKTKPFSHVFYLHSLARFVSERNKFSDKEPKTLYDKALKICKTKIPNHPETAVNLIFSGRNAKRRKKPKEAMEKLEKALPMLSNLLGDHFMTALCLKDLADLFLFIEDTDPEGLEKALNYYRKAMDVMEKLGTRNQKESILTMKNYGICHEKKGNFEEAEKMLKEAEITCDSEIEGDHTWKVTVKNQLALFYHNVATKQENEGHVREDLLSKMEESLKGGLGMCYRLNKGKKKIDHLPNKESILAILKKYPKRFPKELYLPDEPV
ncbi:E3 ubiquitin-protein ligase DZIP3 [Acropora cervicornis]|uniref:E3 ubiquitin-protein ligase DZIP3 n=1 Tax=Acropora cervicornis TaxID=6130 RepID=A0AAD9QB96_ACRCE|nr:E3 ubiquitin-protein ligase DZIP3 [Acropora cervicornis]